MNKLDYITRQFLKAENKRLEHYIVTRIWHLLNDLTLKFVTQQFVIRPEGRALTDMYFPQLQIHIEIDEGHHKRQIELDKLRELDIINATGHEILRIDVTQNIEHINNCVDNILERLKEKKSKVINFKDWNIEAEQNPQTYIDKRSIDFDDNVAFRTMVDAANCFGKVYKEKGIWKGGIVHPKEQGKIIWFPKLYPNGKWENSISDDEQEIYEKHINAIKALEHINKTLSRPHNRIVFARVKSNLGDIMYRFKGEYKLDESKTLSKNMLVWKRIGKSVKTYSTN